MLEIIGEERKHSRDGKVWAVGYLWVGERIVHFLFARDNEEQLLTNPPTAAKSAYNIFFSASLLWL